MLAILNKEPRDSDLEGSDGELGSYVEDKEAERAALVGTKVKNLEKRDKGSLLKS